MNDIVNSQAFNFLDELVRAPSSLQQHAGLLRRVSSWFLRSAEATYGVTGGSMSHGTVPASYNTRLTLPTTPASTPISRTPPSRARPPHTPLSSYQVADGKVTPSVVELYKTKYAELHAYVLSTYEREKNLLKKAKTLNQELLGERIKLEKQSIRKHEEAQLLGQLEKDREQSLKEASDCDDREAMLQFELVELRTDLADHDAQLAQMRKENEDMVEPEIRRVADSIAASKEELQRTEANIETEKRRRNELSDRLESNRVAQLEMEEERMSQRANLAKLQGDPDRIKKQADVVNKALENLASEAEKIEERIQACDGEILAQANKRKEIDEVSRDLGRRLELHRATIEQRERDVEVVQKSLEYEKDQHQKLLTRRVRLDLEKTEVLGQAKGEADKVTRTTKELDGHKRRLKRQTGLCEEAKRQIPNMKMQLTDLKHEMAHHELENKAFKKHLKELKQEEEILMCNYLKHEQVEKSKKSELDREMSTIKELESQLAQWAGEERKQSKTIAVLTAQREIKARDASKSSQLERETQEDLKVKELIILDLGKKYTETTNRLKEFSALYDVVKNERNKYVNLIQASSQALAEMKEKIKILQNEVEILRNESLAKDRALAKEALDHHTAQCHRDALRLESNKCSATYRSKQQQVEQQIVEIDKLNSVVNNMERDMLLLKSRYELVVEGRNLTGVQLIDRNDELCILYEKHNIQEQQLRKGKLAVREKETNIRMLKIAVAEVQRQIEVVRKQQPDIPALAKEVLDLQSSLAEERETTEELCHSLETPKNMHRWRALEGEDPDAEQLTGKIQVRVSARPSIECVH